MDLPVSPVAPSWLHWYVGHSQSFPGFKISQSDMGAEGHWLKSHTHWLFSLILWRGFWHTHSPLSVKIFSQSHSHLPSFVSLAQCFTRDVSSWDEGSYGLIKQDSEHRTLSSRGTGVVANVLVASNTAKREKIIININE